MKFFITLLQSCDYVEWCSLSCVSCTVINSISLSARSHVSLILLHKVRFVDHPRFNASSQTLRSSPDVFITSGALLLAVFTYGWCQTEASIKDGAALITFVITVCREAEDTLQAQIASYWRPSVAQLLEISCYRRLRSTTRHLSNWPTTFELN